MKTLPLDAQELRALPHETVCVTGGGGYVASHIVARLLSAGAVVHVTTRSLASTAHLASLPGAAERMKVFTADLLQEGSFDEAVAGCSALVHTASPYMVNVPRGKEKQAVVDPAVKGMMNILSACVKHSVHAVVITASTACAFTDPHEKGKGHVFTGDDWNKILEDSSAAEGPLAYFYAKAAAEKEAYAFQVECQSKAHNSSTFRLASILPGGIYGPPLSPRLDSESVAQCHRMLTGRMPLFAPLIGMGAVDVRDVAAAHCRALARPNANGRYLINARSVYFLPLAAQVLSKAYPHLSWWLPHAVSPYWGAWLFGPWLGLPRSITRTHYARKPAICTDKAGLELGMREYIQPEQSVLDMAERILEMGL